MIETYYGLNTMATPAAFVAALLIGFLFGFVLERAGFGSSRRLAGIFYFTDMTVLKVMFAGLITAMLGLIYALGFGLVSPTSLFFAPTKYGAQILGGFIFGIGFVIGGWCPGTAAVGAAAGKIDALIFLGGAVVGSLLYNETYFVTKSLATADAGVCFAYDAIGVERSTFAFLFTLVAIAAFWCAETIEYVLNGTGKLLNSRFLKAFTIVLVTAAFGTFAFSGDRHTSTAMAGNAALSDQTLLAGIEEGRDHISCTDLADKLMAGHEVTLIDLRPPREYATFHLPGARNIPLPQLEQTLSGTKNVGTIVLYSNGMTHPAQGRDALFRLGYRNVYILTDGLTGFRNEILKPVSLRDEPLSPAQATKVNRWRSFFATERE